jgi:hypothetical protein
MNNASGKVTLSASMNISISSTIELYDNVELDMANSILWATADVDVINMHQRSCIHDGTIRVSGVGTYSKSVINVSGGVASFYVNPGYYSGKIYNMNLISGGARGYGIHMYIANTATSQEIFGWQISKVNTYCFDISFYLHNKWATGGGGTGGWINGNQFENLVGYGDHCFINLSNTVKSGTAEGWTAIHGNTFDGINYQPNVDGTTSRVGISVDGQQNTFTNIMIWDVSLLTNSSIFTRNPGSNYNSFSGSEGFSWSKIKSQSSYNSFYSSGTQTSTAWAGSKVYAFNVTELNRYHNSATGIKFYQSTIGNPYTYFYGRDTGSGTNKFGLLLVNTAGAFQILADTGEELWLSPNQGSHGTVVLDDVLKLSPRTTTPSSLTEGMIWVNGTSHHIYCYLNGVSVQLD